MARSVSLHGFASKHIFCSRTVCWPEGKAKDEEVAFSLMQMFFIFLSLILSCC